MPAYADTMLPNGLHLYTDDHTLKNEYEIKMKDIDIVVSGMSGRFPESENIEEFSHNLYAGVDMVTENDRRYKPGIFGLPTRSGKLKDLKNFDASYFGVSPRQAHAMDPQMRILLEAAYESIFDSGYQPDELKGKNIGVYVGVSESEAHDFLLSDPEKITGYELTGCCRAMMANRLSFSLDLKGPSLAIDTACSSALVALQTAWAAIKSDKIEGAIVAGCNLNLTPASALQFHGLSMLSKDGKCKAFDKSGDGYARSEAIVAVYLQRSETARRIYAHLVQVGTNTDGNKGEGITFPSGKVQKELLLEVYRNANIDPNIVSYVEAHGTGTKVGDPQELNAIADILCYNRKTPLLIGSVKSNMGHSESASGLCSLVKVLLSIQKKEIPGNLHFKAPNPAISALNDGSLQVVSENILWNGSYAAVNCFGFGGANVHVLVKSPAVQENIYHRNVPCIYDELVNKTVKEYELPTLIFGSGRTEESVETLLKQSIDKDSHALNYLLSYLNTPLSHSQPFRGYIVKTRETEEQNESMKVIQCSPFPAPTWYIFSGMGSQWKGCGKQLMHIPVFAKSMMKCRLALLPYGVDVLKIITTDQLTSTTNSFIAIAAVQVGLVDVLRDLGISNIEGMIGHSVGELGCGYADGALTAEQSVLAAYWRGRAVEEANLPPGAMTALGLSSKEAEDYIEHNSVVVACHNSVNSVTLSGPIAEVEKLEDMFVLKEIFVKRVNSGGIAFHHYSLKKAAPRLLEELKKIISIPKSRSHRWISSSIPEESWDSKLAQTASAEYLVNNLVSPVLFSQALAKVPENATIIEISPHALMQAILKRAIPSAIQIPIIRKEATDQLMHSFEAFGKLYLVGQKIDLQKLYPEVSLPVPSSTPSISNMIKWDHSSEFDVTKFSEQVPNAEFKFEIDINSAEFSFLDGHSIDGRILFPATGYLVIVWKALAKLFGSEWATLSVTFSNVSFHHATVFTPMNNSVTFTVRILPSMGNFEVLSADNIAVSGSVHIGVNELIETDNIQKILNQICCEKKVDFSSKPLILTKQDIYKELKLRGYTYGGLFKGITSSDLEGVTGQLSWENNWIIFLDIMLQFSLLGSPTRSLLLPTRIRKVTIQPKLFLQGVLSSGDTKMTFVDVKNCRDLGITVCPGIVIHGLKASLAPRKVIVDEPIMESYDFIPNCISSTTMEQKCLNMEMGLKVATDIVLENQHSKKIKILQIGKETEITSDITTLYKCIVFSFETNPLLENKFSFYCKYLTEEEKAKLEDVGVNIIEKPDKIEVDKQNLIILNEPNTELMNKVKSKTFILCHSLANCSELRETGFKLIFSMEHFNIYLFRKVEVKKKANQIIQINASDTNYNWVDLLKKEMTKQDDKILWLLSEDGFNTGLLGMFNCLKREPSGQKLRCIWNGRKSKMTSTEFENIVEADLSVNIFIENDFGTMRHLPLPSPKSEINHHSYLNVLTRGDLSSLTWLRKSSTVLDEEQNLLTTVYFAPLNFRDIMLATGKLPPDALPGNLASKDCVLGLEFAGLSANDERVMGLLEAGGLSTIVKSDPHLTWKIPDSWSLKEAATVPVVYSTAYYALVVRGNLKRGESVLIHAGSGGVGQAAISVALSRGCTVFTTVSSEKKKIFLKSKFSQLKEENFSHSRNGSFEFDILFHTQGKGVDIVLNSLSGELLQASIRCLKEHGRFLEIGKADLSNNTSLGMSVFLKNVTFHGILLDSLISGPVEEKKRLQELLYDGISRKEVLPLEATIFPWQEAENAFRFMASGKHIGKILLEIVSENSSSTDNNLINTSITSRYQLWPSPIKTYLITGGLGGLGLEIAEWLIRRGAKNLVLTSRKGIKTGYQAFCVRRWKENGITIKVLLQDASTIQDAESLIYEASKTGPIGGIFHLAMILEDSLFENQNAEKFKTVSKVKGGGALALDISSRKLCPELEHWITFSSVASGRGNAGQSNYGWANSITERIAEQRQMDGLPGLSIQWGGIGDVGVLADTLGNIEVAGTKPQSIQSVLSCLDILIGCGSAVVSSFCIAPKITCGKNNMKKSSVSSIANVLGIRDFTKSPMNVTLGDLGLDSLMAVEVKQTIERDLDILLGDDEIRELTFDKLNQLELGIITPVEDKIMERTKQEEFPWINYSLTPQETFRNMKEINDASKIPLFIASPIQGTAESLKEVIENINTSVVAMQYTDDVNVGSIADMAMIFSELIDKIQPDGPIHLAGYSFGGAIACEIANQMEKKGKRPSSLILLDGSQSYAANIIENYKAKFEALSNGETSEKMSEQIEILGESEALIIFAIQFCKIDSLSVKNELLKMKNFEERKKHISKIIFEAIKMKNCEINSKLTEKKICKSAEMFYGRLKAGFYYSANGLEITSPTLLVRASDNQHAVAFGRDYGLTEVVKGSLEIAEVSGTHESFICGESGLNVANLVNNFLAKCS